MKALAGTFFFGQCKISRSPVDRSKLHPQQLCCDAHLSLSAYHLPHTSPVHTHNQPTSPTSSHPETWNIGRWSKCLSINELFIYIDKWMKERYFECVKYECEKIKTIYFWIVWHWHCTKLARYNRSRQCSQKFPLFGYFHLNQTSSQSRAPPLDKVNLIFVENKNVFGSSPIIYFLSTICCIWRIGWNLFPPGQQKLKSHYVVMPIMILSFINRTYLK